MKLNEIGDLSSILKDNMGEGETMQDIEVADHHERVFDPRIGPGGSHNSRQTGKESSKGMRQERSREELRTIPNNEQNEKRKPKDL